MDPSVPDPQPSFFRRFRWPIVAVVELLLAVTAGPWVYISLFKAEPADRLSLDAVDPTPSDTEADPTLEGLWTITSQSAVQYRVQETLFGQAAEATGEARGITGTATISDAGVDSLSVEVDVSSFASNEPMRDAQFEGRIMETSEFPTANFALSTPIAVEEWPTDGAEITVMATGDLTMHGVTNSVTFEVVVTRTGDSMAAIGSIPITFTDYGIDDPSGGPASVGTTGELELLLVFARR